MQRLLIKEVIGPIIITVVSIVLYNLIKKILLKVFSVKFSKIDLKRQKTLQSIFLNVIKYFIFIVSLFMILDIYGVDTKTLLASLGVVGLAVSLSLQDLLKDIISGMAIIVESQYQVGDIVTIGNFKGEVIELGMKTTKLKSYGGEVKIISNRNITEVINHNLKHSMAILEISMSSKVDIESMQQKLEEISQYLNTKIKNLKNNIKVLGVDKIDESKVYYRVVAETQPLKNTEVQRNLIKEFKKELDTRGIINENNQVVIKSE
ncbi:MAG TPA: mechanosensitive ion channel [Tenericutes bacterium]|nr:mechanosensitive ion channel [Mycoplasmatota bacterium]